MASARNQAQLAGCHLFAKIVPTFVDRWCHVVSTENSIRCQWRKWKITYNTFFYNHFMDHGYFADVCMEPMFWFVDNFTKFLGPFFVFSVCGLTASVIVIAYWIGLPYWWNKSPMTTVALLLVGHWLLVNICFHYYMAASTLPGYPPEHACVAWLNNCIGHYNHRYFFLYMVYMVLGVFFLMVFGFELAYTEVWMNSDQEEELEGHSVRFNNSVLIRVVSIPLGETVQGLCSKT
uniref:Palmitoyltransferase n=1 Tax=Timema cristinae TaxID=61476 RepID=A0A7R9GWI2_TIMCR|nr:unnamed protein product [Timema cristinae]